MEHFVTNNKQGFIELSDSFPLFSFNVVNGKWKLKWNSNLNNGMKTLTLTQLVCLENISDSKNWL